MLPNMESFKDKKILVVGDLMLDQYYTGRVKRISPEAPVPVVQVTGSEFRLGGAANVAANVIGLGAQCILAGYVGKDSHAEVLRQQALSASLETCFTEWDRPTITKTRIIGAHQQMLRLDFEVLGAVSTEQQQNLVAQILRILPTCHAVVISDYAKGCADYGLCSALISSARSKNIPVLVDPKTNDWERYRGATLVTPNFGEFKEVVGEDFENLDDSIEARTQAISEKFGLENLLVTRSERGMTLQTAQNQHVHFHTEAREVFDVSGAGDTVVATIATCLALGMSLAAAVKISNVAAGIVVGKAGTVPILAEDLRRKLHSVSDSTSKLRSVPELAHLLRQEQAKGKVVVFTNGCFDILHRGHLNYLRSARQLGDMLVVALNADESVRRLKGPTRPVNNEQDRAYMMSALEFVDHVCLFEEDDPVRLLQSLCPDILVKGGDYAPDQVLGREHAKEVRILPFVDGYSTTSTIARMQQGDPT